MCKNILGPIENYLRQAGQPRDLDPVTLIRSTGNDLAQKNDLLVPFADRDIEITDSAALFASFVSS